MKTYLDQSFFDFHVALRPIVVFATELLTGQSVFLWMGVIHMMEIFIAGWKIHPDAFYTPAINRKNSSLITYLKCDVNRAWRSQCFYRSFFAITYIIISSSRVVLFFPRASRTYNSIETRYFRYFRPFSPTSIESLVKLQFADNSYIIQFSHL